MHEKWHHINEIQNYIRNMLGLRLILLKQDLPKEWEAAGESQLTTLTSESGYHKKQGRRSLYPTAFPMSTEQFSFFPLFAFILFFLPAARPQCHLPCQRGLCHQGARTPECQERQQEALNQATPLWAPKLFVPQMPEQSRYPPCLNTLNVTPVPESPQKE